jgi:AcrR family transcriptional regulator
MDVESDLNQRQIGKLKTRQDLLDAALELFAEKGFANTHASAIAERAGVAVGTIYLHFGSKNGLLRELLVEIANEIHARVESVYTTRPTDPPEELARAHIEAMVQYIEENRQYAPFVLGYALSRHPIGTHILDLMIGQVEAHIREGQEAGSYRADIDPHLAARAEGSMNLGRLSWWAENPTLATREEIIDTLAKIRLSGLHATQEK